MKKVNLLINACLAVLLLANCTSDKVVEIPDANFKAYLLEKFDVNKDGQISIAEAKAVKKMDCSGKGIVSLTGIEKFVNLESLNCSNNLFSDLTFPNNKKLTDVISDKSDDIVEIPDANFKAYLLENFDTNKDGNISVAEAKAVKEINCYYKNIESLDGIERFLNLASLNCSNNQLSELDVRLNRNLNKLVCTNNEVGLMIYVGWSSPLRSQAIQKPDSGTPQIDPNISQMLDVSKCTYDQETSNVLVYYDF